MEGGTEKERGREEERVSSRGIEIFYPLVHSTDAHNICIPVRLKSRSRNLITVFHVGGRDQNT